MLSGNETSSPSRDTAARYRGSERRYLGAMIAARHVCAPALPVLAALFTLLACSSGHRDTGLQPPPETGQIAIDMEGWWAISEIARVDSSDPPPGPDPMALPFLSIQPGQTISIHDGVAYDLQSGERLHENWTTLPGERRYSNVATNRFWRFEAMFFRTEDCVMDLAIRAAFGSVGENEMYGFVSVHYLTSCPQPAVVRPDPNGLFAVTMHRVAAAQLGR